MIGIEFNANNAASWHIINVYTSKFIHKIADAVIVAKYDGRIKSVVQSFYGFYQITVAEIEQ